MVFKMENEVWRPVAGFEGLYEISSLGRVKSVDRYVKQGTKNGGIRTFHVREKILPHKINTSGYPIVVLTRDGKSVWMRVHRLLAAAFIPNPDNLPEIDHIDTNKQNYNIDNLRWVTHAQNMNNETTKKDSRSTVYSDEAIMRRILSSKNNGARTSPKTIFQFSLEGDLIAEHISINRAAKAVGLTRESIRIVIDKDGWTSAGYVWRTSNVI